MPIGRYTPIHARRTNCPLCPWEGRNRGPIATGIEEGSRVAGIGMIILHGGAAARSTRPEAARGRYEHVDYDREGRIWYN